MDGGRPTIHGTALVLAGAGLLIRGAPGAGKSSLALALLDEADRAGIEAALIGDDRLHLERRDGRLVARPAGRLAGMIELRGLGLLAIAHRAEWTIDMVVDLLPAAEVPRLPETAERSALLEDVALPRIALPAGGHDLTMRVRAALTSFGIATPWHRLALAFALQDADHVG